MRLTTFFAHKMACECRRRIILSWIKPLNCPKSIASYAKIMNFCFILAKFCGHILWRCMHVRRTLLHLIYGYGRENEGNLNFKLTDSWPKDLCKKDKHALTTLLSAHSSPLGNSHAMSYRSSEAFSGIITLYYIRYIENLFEDTIEQYYKFSASM